MHEKVRSIYVEKSKNETKLEEAENPEQRIEIIWKAILGRLPKESEKDLVSHQQDDLIWALLNSNEYRFVR